MRCPECDADQPERAPFCDQCGYRFRAQETQVEGLPAITAGMLRRAHRERGREEAPEVEEIPTTLIPSIPAPGEDGFVRGRVGTVPEPPDEVDASRELTTQPEGLASVGSHDRSGASLELRTVVEGLPAVTREAAEAARKRSPKKTRPAAAPAAPATPAAPARPPEETEPAPIEAARTIGMPAIRPLSSALVSSSSSGLIASPLAPPPAPINKQSLLAFGAVWATITALGALFLYGAYVMQPRQVHDHKPVSAAPSAPITIPASTTRLGLNKKKRAYLLRACFKVATNADEACDEEKLLAGEFPDREVALPAYRIDSQEVTQARYEGCVRAGKCAPPDYKKCKVYTHQGYQLSMRVPRAMQAPDLPAICLTRDQAQTFCKAQGGDLPTHDQWERAARGDDERLYPWGETWDPTWANWGELDVTRMPVVGRIDGYGFTGPPGAYPDGKSADGVLDMAGNVAEWVRAEEAPADPKQGFARGGDFTSDPSGLRTTIRKKIPVDRGRTDVGFRCVYAP